MMHMIDRRSLIFLNLHPDWMQFIQGELDNR